MNSHVISLRKRYADILYIYYTAAYKIRGFYDYPEYIAEETRTPFGATMLQRLLRLRYIEKKEDGCFRATEKGLRLLNENVDAIVFFRMGSPYVQYEEFVAEKKRLRTDDCSRILGSVLLKKEKKAWNAGDYETVRKIDRDLALLMEGKDRENAYRYALRSLKLLLSGTEYASMIDEARKGWISKAAVVRRFSNYVCLDESLRSLIQRLGYPIDAITILNYYCETDLSFNLLTPRLFYQAVMNILNKVYSNSIMQNIMRDRFLSEYGEFCQVATSTAEEEIIDRVYGDTLRENRDDL